MRLRRPILLLTAALLAGCGSNPAMSGSTAQGWAPSAAAPAGLVLVTVTVPVGMDVWPLGTPRQALVPPGWTMSVWARVLSARLAAWAPDDTLLVSVPENGSVVRLRPDGQGTADVSVLLDGLNQPHGLAFAGATLYVAQSDRVDAYSYSTGGRR